MAQFNLAGREDVIDQNGGSVEMTNQNNTTMNLENDAENNTVAQLKIAQHLMKNLTSLIEKAIENN